MKRNLFAITVVSLLAGFVTGKYFSGFSDAITNEPSGQKLERKNQRWTCSMHPQIDLPQPGTCPICGMDLIPKSGDEEPDSGLVELSEAELTLAGIRTMRVKKGSDTSDPNGFPVSFPGSIEVNTDKIFVQTAHFGGRIEKLFFQSEGAYIKKGSIIALLYSPELVTAQNELLEAYYIKNEQPELYNAVRNKLKNWKLTEAQINRVENTKKVILNFPMYADQSGYIRKVSVQNGQHVREGTPMFELADLSEVWGVFEVYEPDLQNIRVGDEVNISVHALPGKTFRSKVFFISPELHPSSKTAIVRTRLNNSGGLLKPGMLISARLLKKTHKTEKIVIPKSAVLWTGKRSVVYVKTSPDKPVFEMREIELGQSFADSYEVLSGLNEGDEIVVHGTFVVDASAQLQGKKSMMNKNPSDKAPKSMKCGAGKCGAGM